MDKDKYNKIENILNNIKYTRSAPPKVGSYFELNGKYSENVDIEFGSDINRYFRIKYFNELENAAYIVLLPKYNAIIFYDCNMNETKIIHSFNCFYYGISRTNRIDYMTFLNNKIFSSEYFYVQSYNALIYLRVSDMNTITLKDARIRIDKIQGPVVSFHIISESLSKKFSCYFPYTAFSCLNVDPMNILSVKEIQRAEDWEQKREACRVVSLLEELYNNNPEVFDLYDSLNDKDKLKLKLTGKL